MVQTEVTFRAAKRSALVSGLTARALQVVATLTGLLAVVWTVEIAIIMAALARHPVAKGGATSVSATIGKVSAGWPVLDISPGAWSPGTMATALFELGGIVFLGAAIAVASWIAFLTLGRVARGEVFSGRIAKGLALVGGVLLIAAPIARLLMTDLPLWAVGFIALLGAVFLLFSAAIRQGAAMQTELDEML